MSVGILGSGFGIYGYLPALVKLGKPVVMPVRYREKLLGRPDSRLFDAGIRWVEDEAELLRVAESVIITQRPEDQVLWVKRALHEPRISRLVLEKPLAPTPDMAEDLIGTLLSSGRSFRIGFTFRYTEWATAVRIWLAHADAGATLSCRWRFRAHHYAAGLENWKRRPSQGGGALRFYGIHLIALAAELGYDTIDGSRVEANAEDEARIWRATITGPNRPNWHIIVDSNAPEPLFAVDGSGPASAQALEIALRDPFDDLPSLPGLDRRVGMLSQLCNSLFSDGQTHLPWYRASVDLWKVIENETEVVRSGG